MGKRASEGDAVRHVLLVEDDYAAARLVELAFGEVDQDIVVEIAPDGQTALDTLLGDCDATYPDIVLLDLDLTDIHGTEVLQELRARTERARPPVVVLSSNDDRETIDRCYAQGATTYIVKPDDYAGLVEVAMQVSSYWGSTTVALPSCGD